MLETSELNAVLPVGANHVRDGAADGILNTTTKVCSRVLSKLSLGPSSSVTIKSEN